MKNQATSPPHTNGSFILEILAGLDKWPLGSLLFLYPYFIFSVKKTFKFILTVLGLCCCAGFSLVEMSRGYSTDAMLRLLIAVVSLVAKHGLQGALASVVVASRLQNTGSIVVAKGLSCA